MALSCWELVDFDLDGQIDLGDRMGLVKLCKSDDDVLMLVANVDAIDVEQPHAGKIATADSILGFVLDIGIQRTKMLTMGNGFYFGNLIRTPQSRRKISQDAFDRNQFDAIERSINTSYQSADRGKVTNAIRCQNLLDTYNNARLLYPNFISESYLSLMRIIEAVSQSGGRFEFALAAAKLSPDLNREIHARIAATAAYRERLDKAAAVFAGAVAHARQHGAPYRDELAALDAESAAVFACFVSAYQYRNKFMHIGFPFPATVAESMGFQDDLGTAYLHPTTGMKWSRMMRPDGMREEDLIDVHETIEPAQWQEFRDTFFYILPTWYFVKFFAREAIVKAIRELDVAGP